jgi:predicted ATPase
MAGSNGNGKSTAIQALLYLRKSIEKLYSRDNEGDYNVTPINYFIGTPIPLNGDYCLQLGNSSHVLNRNAKGDIYIGLNTEKDWFELHYTADNLEPQLYLELYKIVVPTGFSFPVQKREFYYLNAERLGPRVTQGMQHSDFLNAGWQGENTAQLLGTKAGYIKISSKRKFEGKGSSYIEEQVNQWLNFIMPGVKVGAKTDPATLVSQILLENPYTVSEPTLATNLGFGISYVLPIIATGLIAEKGSYFIVENPEAHLHPSAQSRIGQFLAMVAAAGVNVIVETHSDHVINGIQIATAKQEIDHKLITINYFSYKEGAVQPDVQPISMTPKGELSDWPSGFFDQTQVDYAELFKLRKG